MRALRKLKNGKGNVEIAEIEIPQLSDNEVLIQVERAGICGTDVHIYHDKFDKVRPPVTLSHEFCGIVVEVGPAVSGWNKGDRVTCETSAHYCGSCPFCQKGQTQLCDGRLGYGYSKDGAFANYIKVQHHLLHKLPDHISFTEGALCEPLAVATHVVMERSSVKEGDIVLVAGPGTIGLLVLQVVLNTGARAIVAGLKKDEERLQLASKLGAEFTVEVDTEDLTAYISDITKGSGVDIAYDCTGSAGGVKGCLSALRKGGEFVAVGLLGQTMNFDLDQVTLREINIKGCFAHNHGSWEKAINLLNLKKIDLKSLVSAELPLQRWKEAFEMFQKCDGLKVLLLPNDS
jgi:L-iditol 2-dehydrogenase